MHGAENISAVPPVLLLYRVSLELRQVLSLLRGTRVSLLATQRSRNQLRKQYPFTRHRLAASDGSLKPLSEGLSSFIVFDDYEIKWILTQNKNRVNNTDPTLSRTFIVFSGAFQKDPLIAPFRTCIFLYPADRRACAFRLTNPNNSVSLY